MVVELTYGPYRVKNVENTGQWQMVLQPLGEEPFPQVWSVPDMGFGRLVWAGGGRPTDIVDAASYAAALTKLITLVSIDDDLVAAAKDMS